MAAVSKAYGVGDTVFVWYFETSPLSFMVTPQSRVVSSVDVNTGANSATVKFSNGNSIVDGATPRVFTTELLCAIAIVDDLITASAATVALDTTTLSLASTVGQPSPTLGRVD